METPTILQLSGRITLHDVEKTVAAVNQQGLKSFQVVLDQVEEMDITCIQMLIAMKEQFQDRFTLEIGNVDPNLNTLLESSGVLKLLNDFSN